MKSPEEDKNTTDCFDKNKFKKILDIVDSNKFNHKNKIGEFKYNEIKDLVNNIKNNTISETDAKKDLKRLFKIKNVELKKYKIHTPTQKDLLNLFNVLLKTILVNNDNDNNNENVNGNNNDNDDDGNNDNYDDNNSDNDNDDNNDHENYEYNKIKQLNDSLDEIVDESKYLKSK